jgi:28 kDa A-kinase anchor
MIYEEGSNLVEMTNSLLRTWSKKFMFYTKILVDEESYKELVSEFSLPTKEKTIPISTAKVYFYLKKDPAGRGWARTFRFENDTLIHNLNNTIRLTEMEKWLESIMEKKVFTRDVIFLGTEFESTRIKEQRLIDTLKVDPVPPKIPDENQLNGKYQFQYNMSLETWENPGLEQANLKVIQDNITRFLRSLDAQDIQMLSLRDFNIVPPQTPFHYNPLQ